MPFRVLCLLSVTLLLAACGGGDNGDAGDGGGGSRPPAATATATAADSVTGAAGVQDCGSFILDQGEGLPQDAAQCLIDAVRNGTPARLLQTRPTVEGDPIPTTYVTGTDGRVEVTTDSTDDQFGSGRVERQTCTGPSFREGTIAFATCAPVS